LRRLQIPVFASATTRKFLPRLRIGWRILLAQAGIYCAVHAMEA
jgi:hypothetical protein